MIAKRFFLSFVLIFLLYSLTKGVFIYFDRLKIYRKLEKKRETLKKRKIELQTRIKKAESLDFLERTIRNKLQLVRQNETVVILSYPTPTPIILKTKEKSIPLQWLEIFQ